jgi:hypothetical protein
MLDPTIGGPMPELSRFLGIVIAMYYRDHGPPHFHAYCGSSGITVEIESGRVKGVFPARALAYVQEWRTLHLVELMQDWELATLRKPLRAIAPLE